MNITEIKNTKLQNREFWISHVKQWEESKKSQRDYCMEMNIKHSTFGYWRSVFTSESKNIKKFIPVKISPPQNKILHENSVIEIKLLNGHIIKVPITMNIKDIAILIQCLGALHA